MAYLKFLISPDLLAGSDTAGHFYVFLLFLFLNMNRCFVLIGELKFVILFGCFSIYYCTLPKR